MGPLLITLIKYKCMLPPVQRKAQIPRRSRQSHGCRLPWRCSWAGCQTPPSGRTSTWCTRRSPGFSRHLIWISVHTLKSYQIFKWWKPGRSLQHWERSPLDPLPLFPSASGERAQLHRSSQRYSEFFCFSLILCFCWILSSFMYSCAHLSSATAGCHAHLLEVRVEVVDVDHLDFQRRILFSCPGQLNRWPCHSVSE